MVEATELKVYQHLEIRESADRAGWYTSVVDNDESTAKEHFTYNEALLRLITYLAQARVE